MWIVPRGVSIIFEARRLHFASFLVLRGCSGGRRRPDGSRYRKRSTFERNLTSKWEPLALLWAPSGHLLAPSGPLAVLWAPSGHLMAQIRDPRATKGRSRMCQEAIWEPSKNLNIHLFFDGFSTFEAPGGVQRGTWVDLGGTR